MTRFTHHTPSKVVVSYGPDWTPLFLAAAVIGALAWLASLLLSFLAVIAGAIVAAAALSAVWLVLILRRDGLWLRQRPASCPAVRAVHIAALPARQARAIENRPVIPAEYVITDAVPQPREQS